MRTAVCDQAILSEFLGGRLNAETERQVVDHLTACPNCQQAVERLAGGENWFDQARMYLSPEREQVGGGMPIVLPAAEATASLDDDEAVAPPLALGFLTPTDDPHSLGRVGTYEVMGVVGRGGTGIVLKAFDAALDRFVAIKVLSPNLAASAAARRRFAREAQAAAAVVHEHVVPIHAVSVHQGLPYIVMQYVSGRSLQQRLDARGPLPLAEILRIGMQTASGLAAAHAQGLVHRDVKPANILLENGVERVLVTDFGLARTMDDASLTCSGVIAGTPQYMAPEQARGEGVSERTDLFSLGSVLYALATGHSPFRAETTMGVLHRICKESPRPMQEVNPEIPHWLSGIVGRLLAKNPAKRFASAAEVAEVLQRQLARLQSPSGLRATSFSELVSAVRGAIARRRRSLVLAGSLAATLVTGGALYQRFCLGPADNGQLPARSHDGQSAVDPRRSIEEESQSDHIWVESLGDVQARLTRLEADLHSSAAHSDPVGGELSALRERLTGLNAELPSENSPAAPAH